MWNFPQLRPPLVSVVICFLNGERFLAEAVDSVLAQKHRPLEILLVDDGSTDGSAAIAADYARRHPFIRLLSHPGRANRGVSASRNLGLRTARGRYVAFLDADDVWLPGKLEAELRAFRRHPRAAMVCGDALLWFSWAVDPRDLLPLARRLKRVGGRPVDAILPVGRGKLGGSVRGFRLLKLHLRKRGCLPQIGAALIRRSAAIRVGGFEDVFRDMYEDQVFFSKLAVHERVCVLRECFMKYRQHDASMCNQVRRAGSWKNGPQAPGSKRRLYLEWLHDYLPRDDRRFNPIRKMIRMQIADLEPGSGAEASAP